MKALIDVFPYQFLRAYHLQQGKILLAITDLTDVEVAWRVGFKGRSHFCEVFNDKFGVFPTYVHKYLICNKLQTIVSDGYQP